MSPEGVLYSFLSDGPHRNHKPTVGDLILPGTEDIVVAILRDETAGEADTVQHTGPAQDLLFQLL